MLLHVLSDPILVQLYGTPLQVKGVWQPDETDWKIG